MPNMVHTTWRGSKTVLIALNGRDLRDLPTEEEWQAYFEHGSKVFAPDADLTHVRSLAISDGGAPSSKQREQIRNHLGDREMCWALITTSRFARGVGAALSWFYPTFKSFAPRDFLRAVRFLCIPEAEIPSLWQAIVTLDERIRTQAVAEIASGGSPLSDVLG
jgi:hypothetical protein